MCGQGELNWPLIVATVANVLQIVGVVLVFLDIAAAEKLFGVEHWWRRLANPAWTPVRRLLSRLGLRRGIVHLAGALSASVGTSARLALRVKRNPGTTVEARLASIEMQLDDLRSEINAVTAESAEAMAKLRRRLDDAESRLIAQDAELNRLVKEANVGTIHYAVAGALLILFGLALAAVAPFVCTGLGIFYTRL